MEFKDRLKELREETGISAQKLAQELNKSESAIRMWESGKSKPDVNTLIELCDYFNCSADYILGRSEYKNESFIENTNKSNQEISQMIESLPIVLQGELLRILNELLANLIEFFNNGAYYHIINYMSYLNNSFSTIAKIIDLSQEWSLREKKNYEKRLHKLFNEISKNSQYIFQITNNLDNELKLNVLSRFEEYPFSEFENMHTRIQEIDDYILKNNLLLLKSEKHLKEGD